MPLTEHREGNIFEQTDVQAWGHGVNCQGAMGSGIAVGFRKMFPEMYEEYRLLCKAGELQLGDVFPWRDPKTGRWIYNIASQFQTGRDARYPALQTGFTQTLAHMTEHGVESLCLPQIGAGIGGLEWDKVRYQLETTAEATDRRLVLITYKG